MGNYVWQVTTCGDFIHPDNYSFCQYFNSSFQTLGFWTGSQLDQHENLIFRDERPPVSNSRFHAHIKSMPSSILGRLKFTHSTDFICSEFVIFKSKSRNLNITPQGSMYLSLAGQ